MEDVFWKYVAYGFLVTQTVALVLLVDFIILGRPYLTLFVIILACTLHFNISRHPELPLSRHWPFLKNQPKSL